MKKRHVAFCLEQAYGHIIPTLGISLELMRRGHRVTYAVNRSFARLITKIQAQPVVIEPLETRAEVLANISRVTEQVGFQVDEADLAESWRELSNERTSSSLAQLQRAYRNEDPDVIVHDDCLDTAGRVFAQRLGVGKVRHISQFLDDNVPMEMFSQDELILMTIPKFFQRNPQIFDKRFRFVGFIVEGRSQVFTPCTALESTEPRVLISATTGLLPQLAFSRLVSEAFRNQPWNGVLSIAGSMDALSAIDEAQLTDTPPNILINSTWGNFDILKYCRLYVGQGGQGSTLEAIYHGVPQILIPPTHFHGSVAQRVSELGLGYCLLPAELSKCTLVSRISEVLSDGEMLERVRCASSWMRNDGGAEEAVDAIEELFR